MLVNVNIETQCPNVLWNYICCLSLVLQSLTHTKPLDFFQVDKSGWWKDLLEGQAREVLELSGKMVILMKILSLSSARSDKALVFSQSLHTLDLIEVFLESMPRLNGSKGNWKKDVDWYR